MKLKLYKNWYSKLILQNNLLWVENNIRKRCLKKYNKYIDLNKIVLSICQKIFKLEKKF